MPTRGSSLAAGLDICSIEELTIQPGAARAWRAPALRLPFLKVTTDASRRVQVSPTKKGLDTLAGVIDADYRGEIGCLLYNAGDETIHLPAQSKICQLIIEKIITPDGRLGR